MGALIAGDISYSVFQTIVYRTDLITDPELMAAVDAELAIKGRGAGRRGHTVGWAAGHVDQMVARADRDAVRRPVSGGPIKS